MEVILTHAKTWVSLEYITLSEMSQLQKNEYCMIPPIWGAPRQSVHWNRKQNGWQAVEQGGNGELVFSECRVSVLLDEKGSGGGCWWWLYNNVALCDAAKLDT